MWKELEAIQHRHPLLPKLESKTSKSHFCRGLMREKGVTIILSVENWKEVKTWFGPEIQKSAKEQ